MAQQKKKKRKSQQAQIDFLTNVSHEFRTPLICIQKSIELILDEKTGGINRDQKHFLEICKRNVTGLLRLINELLDISKLETSEQSLNTKKIDVKKLIRGSVASLQAWAQSKNISFSLSLNEKYPSVLWDEEKIVQMLINIISNAIKFTSENGSIVVSAMHAEGNKALRKIKGINVPLKDTSEKFFSPKEKIILISIKDTGIGLSKVNALKVFERYFQIKSSSIEKTKGTGLGLPIVRQIVEMHHGKLWVDTQFRRGTTFTVALPTRVKV